jgi:hypothetical protein
MSETENLNFNLSLNGDSRNKSSSFRKINLKNVFEAIDKKTIDDDVKDSLKNKAKNYPHQALKLFILNLDRHIAEENKKNINKNKNKINELEFPE